MAKFEKRFIGKAVSLVAGLVLLAAFAPQLAFAAGESPVGSINETIEAGNGFDVLVVDPSGNSSSTVVATPIGSGATYDVVYISGTAESPVVSFYPSRAEALTLENTSIRLPSPYTPEKGLLLRLYVRTGSVQVQVSSNSQDVSYIAYAITESPLHYGTVAKADFVDGSVSGKRISIGATESAQLRQTIDEATRTYSVFSFTASKLRADH